VLDISTWLFVVFSFEPAPMFLFSTLTSLFRDAFHVFRASRINYLFLVFIICIASALHCRHFLKLASIRS
jgi:hypothetical protein